MEHKFHFKIDPPSRFQDDDPVYLQLKFDTDQDIGEAEVERLRLATAEDLKVKPGQVSLVTEQEYLDNTDEDEMEPEEEEEDLRDVEY